MHGAKINVNSRKKFAEATQLIAHNRVVVAAESDERQQSDRISTLY
jgi:hypothetical protein